MLNHLRDFRGGLRILRSDPAFSLVAALTLGLGIAATTTVFSWVDGVLLQPVPGTHHSGALAVLEHSSANGDFLGCAHPSFRDYQRALKQVTGVTAMRFATFIVGPPESARRVSGQIVSANYFAVLGVKAVIGRMFTPEEDRDDQGAYPLAVISSRLWHNQFQSDPGMVGRAIRVNNHQLTVVGVAPPEFRGTIGGLHMDIWVPLSMVVQMGSLNTWGASDRNARFLEVWMRLKPGVALAQVRDEVRSVAAEIAAAFPKTHAGVGADVKSVGDARTGVQWLLRNPLRILTAVCFLVLLIACANVANLLLARSVSRQKEFGIRMAMGATRARMAKQLFSEVMTLSIAGSVVGVALSLWMSDSLVALLPTTGFPIAVESLGGRVSFRILGFTVLVSIACAVLSSLMPVLHASRVPVNEILKEESRSGTSGARAHRSRGMLVVLEVALTAVALVGAGLFGRSFQNSRQLHPGFDVTRVLVAQMYLSPAGYTRDQERLFNRNLRQRLQSAPGITQAAYANAIPLWFGDPPSERIQIEGLSQQGAVINVGSSFVSPG
jgi:predicted permease